MTGSCQVPRYGVDVPLTAARRAFTLHDPAKSEHGYREKASAWRKTGGRVCLERSVRQTRESGCGRLLRAAGKWAER
jgi:hypothetical protein